MIDAIPECETNEALIGRVAVGDRDALEALAERFRRPLLAYLLGLTRDRGLAEEIVQDTLLAAWRGAASYAGRSTGRGWLFGVARRQAHNTLRQRRLSVAEWDALARVASGEPEPEHVVLARASIDEVVDAIERLAPVHREVLLLTFAHELSYAELSEVLEVPLGTVKSRLSNAKRSLRAALDAQGETTR